MFFSRKASNSKENTTASAASNLGASGTFSLKPEEETFPRAGHERRQRPARPLLERQRERHVVAHVPAAGAALRQTQRGAAARGRQATAARHVAVRRVRARLPQRLRRVEPCGQRGRRARHRQGGGGAVPARPLRAGEQAAVLGHLARAVGLVHRQRAAVRRARRRPRQRVVALLRRRRRRGGAPPARDPRPRGGGGGGGRRGGRDAGRCARRGQRGGGGRSRRRQIHGVESSAEPAAGGGRDGRVAVGRIRRRRRRRRQAAEGGAAGGGRGGAAGGSRVGERSPWHAEGWAAVRRRA